MSFWIKPTIEELKVWIANYEPPLATKKIMIRYATDEDATLESIYILHGFGRINKLLAEILCGEDEVNRIAMQRDLIFQLPETQHILSRAKQKLADGGIRTDWGNEGEK